MSTVTFLTTFKICNLYNLANLLKELWSMSKLFVVSYHIFSCSGSLLPYWVNWCCSMGTILPRYEFRSCPPIILNVS